VISLRRTWQTIVLAVTWGAGTASAAAPDVNQFPRTTWTESGHGPLTGIDAIAQDRDGYIWLGSASGLFRFDGVKFAPWSELSTEPLPDAQVRVLRGTKNGDLWVGFGNLGGILRVTNRGVLQRFKAEEGAPTGPIAAIAEIGDEAMLVAGFRGSALFEGGRWYRVDTSEVGRINQLLRTTAGVVLGVSDGGVVRYDAATRAFAFEHRTKRAIQQIFEDSHGRVWCSYAEGELALLGSGDSPGIGVGTVPTAVLATSAGFTWIGSGTGVSALPGRSTPVPSASRAGSQLTGFWSDPVMALFEDREGNIWIGMTRGVMRVTPAPSRYASLLADIPSQSVHSVASGSDGAMYIGTAQGLCVTTGSSVKWYTTREGLPSNRVSSIHVGRSGRVWVATSAGVVELVGEHLVRLPLSDSAWRIVGMTEDFEGALWFADTRGLARWHHNTLKRFENVPEIGPRPAMSAFTDRRGRVWIGFFSGELAVFEDGRFSRIVLTGEPAVGIVNTVFEDLSGTIWIGTTNGFGKLVGRRFVTVGRQDQIQNVASILEDSRGTLWLVTRTVVASFDRQEFDAAAQSPAAHIRYRKIDAADGFTGLIRSAAPSAALGPRGTIWAVSHDGILVVTPDAVPEPAAPSPVRIERAFTDKRSYDPEIIQHLPQGTSRIGFEFTSLDLTAPFTLNFRYRLSGIDEDWVECGACRSASYTNLRPGEYRFLVSAQSRGGPWARPTEWTFTVAPFFYQTWTFYAACAGLVLVIAWAIWRSRLERIRREYASILAERTRLGREVHDTILQGMVGVALQLQCTLESADQPIDTLKTRLQHSRACLEEYIRQTRHAIWALRSSKPEPVDIGAMLRETCTSLAFGVVPIEMTVRGKPQGDHATTAENIIKIGQEAVANAIRHSRATSISIELSYEAAATELCIRDNGQGFDLSSIDRGERPSWGLTSMNERAGELRAELNIESGCSGTTVRLKVPTNRRASHRLSAATVTH
jgi:signal transduction histidine kinase/ligand-binding sensor domain-containing protein